MPRRSSAQPIREPAIFLSLLILLGAITKFSIIVGIKEALLYIYLVFGSYNYFLHKKKNLVVWHSIFIVLAGFEF